MSNSSRCVIEFCNSTPVERSFHEFPSNFNLRQKWFKNINLSQDQQADLSQRAVICSRHFQKECFKSTNTGRKLLYRSAVPTLYLNVPINQDDLGTYGPALEFVDVEAMPVDRIGIRIVPEIGKKTTSPIQKSTCKLTQQTDASKRDLEFDNFCKNLACQLRKMPLEQALVYQAKLQTVMTEERLYQIGTRDSNTDKYEFVVKKEDLSDTDYL